MAVRFTRGTVWPPSPLGRAHISSCLASLEVPLSAQPLLPPTEQPSPLISPHPADHGEFLRSLCDRGHLQSALQALSSICFPLPTATYLSLLRACIKSKSVPLAQGTHAHIVSHRVPLHGFLGDYLVMVLAKCGALDQVHLLASSLPHISVFSWTSIISAYAENGDGFSALDVWQRMQEDGVEPDSFTFVSLFKACGAVPDLQRGKVLHAIARCKGFASNVLVGNAIMGMYANCGALLEVQTAFDEICGPTTASWNMLLSATLEQGRDHKVLELYKHMESDGIEPDSFTFVSLFKACSSIQDLRSGRELHVLACRKGQASNPFVGNTIVNMYKKCGALAEAEDAFRTLPSRDIVSWSGMLSAYVDQGEGEKALCLYRQMQEEGITPDQVMLSTALQACSVLAEKADTSAAYYGSTKQSWLEIGHALHAEARQQSMHMNILTATSLLNMYGKCGSFKEAENVFSTLAPVDIVASNAMLSAYIENKEGKKALLLYNEMQKHGIRPNDITLVTVLQACGILIEKEEVFIEGRSSRVIASDIGRLLHTDVCTLGLETCLPIANTLVSMYGKFRTLLEAESVFKALLEHDIVTWNAILGAFRSLGGQEEKMLHFYKRIQEENVTLDEILYIYIIQACGEAGNLEACKKVHFDVLSAGHDSNVAVVTTLMNAYGCCAALGEAKVLFNKIPQPNVVSWNASIAGFAGKGNYRASLHLLELMSCALVRPNAVSLTSILSVCSHSGLVVEGLKYFEYMSVAHAIPPERTHFKLLIDLFGRAEDFKRIESLLQRLPMPADSIIWACVLDTCCTRGNFKLGMQALDHVLSVQDLH